VAYRGDRLADRRGDLNGMRPALGDHDDQPRPVHRGFAAHTAAAHTALLAVLRTEATRGSGKEPGIMTVTICLPATEVISIDAMAPVDTVLWRCRLCDHHGTATTRPTAHSESIEHLTAEHLTAEHLTAEHLITEHHATIGIVPK
jgi:hypothetical protein